LETHRERNFTVGVANLIFDEVRGENPDFLPRYPSFLVGLGEI
jgi:hypothetical protein